MPKQSKADVRRILDGFRQPVLDCRDLGHAWKRGPLDAHEIDVVTRTLTCLRCECKRTDVVVRRSGEVFRRSYRHSPGYLAKGVGRALSRSDIRRESITRLLEARRKRESLTEKRGY